MSPVAPGRFGTLLGHVRSLEAEYVDFVTRLCEVESPTDRPETQRGVHALLRPALEELGFDVEIVPGERSGDHLLATHRGRGAGDGAGLVPGRPQLLIGHSDTVWPLGTLERMPVRFEGGRLSGPGTLDMKGGLGLIVFALRALRDLGLEPEVAPVVFVNADEEVGSPDSKPHVRRLAESACRALVAEPALGPSGLVKTARKGVGRFGVTALGKAAHAGLDPDAGASAILALSLAVRRLHELNDRDAGRSVNVGTLEGGTRANVVAARAHAEVDVRVTSSEDGRRVEQLVRSLESEVPGVRLVVEGGIELPPLERTPRNRLLWARARAAASELGVELDEALAGGGSDGNTTSLYTATLDGLGCVGDGAHADHEHVVVSASLERCAVLARLLMLPDETASVEPSDG